MIELLKARNTLKVSLAKKLPSRRYFQSLLITHIFWQAIIHLKSYIINH